MEVSGRLVGPYGVESDYPPLSKVSMLLNYTYTKEDHNSSSSTLLRLSYHDYLCFYALTKQIKGGERVSVMSERRRFFRLVALAHSFLISVHTSHELKY